MRNYHKKISSNSLRDYLFEGKTMELEEEALQFLHCSEISLLLKCNYWTASPVKSHDSELRIPVPNSRR